MEKDTRHRRFLLTINNPLPEWTHEKIREALGQLHLQYWCMADEIGLQEQTPHTHVYFVAETSAIRFSTVKGLFPSTQPTGQARSAGSTFPSPASGRTRTRRRRA